MRHLWLCSLILLLAPLAIAARAADGDAPATPGGAAKPAPAVEEVKPELYYLRDKDNRLVPAPGFSLDDFARYYRLQHGLQPSETPPRYNIEQLTLAGQPVGDRVELTATVAIVSLVSDWVRVPLRFDQCVLREAAEYSGPGEHLVQTAPDGSGLICWVRGEPRSEHRLTLKLLAPLAGDARDGRLQLSLPRAAASRLSLRVPLAQAAATASPGLAPEVVAAERISEPPMSAGGLTDEGGAKPAATAESEIRVLGVGGDCWVSWHPPDQSAAGSAADLEASGTMLVKIDGRSVSTDATLSVRGFGAEFDHFHVQLPPGSQLVAGHTPGYTLTPIPADPTKLSENPASPSPLIPHPSSLLSVRLDHKTAGPVDIHLATERAFDVTKPDESLELAGFAVPEAISHRQWGYLAVAVAGDWQVTWTGQTRVRRISELPPTLEQKGVVAGFEYFGQPCSLVVHVAPRRTRVTVEPQYTYTVRSDETRLAATFDYAIRGAKLFDLQIEMPGWEIDRVLPAGQIDANAISTSADGVVTMPLLQPAAGDIEVAVWAHRPHPRGAKTLDWALPRPRADAVGPAEVAILPAGNVSLIPRPDKTVGMSPVAPGWPAASEPVDSRQPLLFHADRPGARFAADLAARPREVSVEASEQVTAGADASSVREILDYTIRYEPLDQLTLEMPRLLWESGKPTFVVENQTLQPRLVPMPAPSTTGAADAGKIRLQAPLRRPALGSLRLEITYSAAHAHLTADGAMLATIPLVAARDGRIASQSAMVSGEPGVQVESRGGGWEATDAAAGRGQSPLHVAGPPTVESLPLALMLTDEHPRDATFVDRAWIQTWLTDTARQDRIVYLLTTAAAQEQLTLPEGVLPEDVELTVDGQSQAPAAGAKGALVVRLSTPAVGSHRPDADDREHRIELRYVSEGHEPRAGRLSLDTPRFAGRVRVLREYWELILSADEHLVAASNGLAPENEWTWRADYLGYQRVPLKNDRQLEQWVDSADAAPAARGGGADAAVHPFDPPPRANRYLFSAQGNLNRFDVVVARRWVVLLTGAAIALAAGLALLYWPALRRPGLVVAAVGLLLLAGFANPDLALLAAQPALAGVGLVALAWVLRRMSVRPVATPVVTAPISARLDRTSIRASRFAPVAPLEPRAPDPNGHEPATTTASVAVDAPSHEPNA